ncbi:MAG: hypothetical protein QOF14_5154 [Hyphomicrobiales bacterium]|jgi:hypothetical protein|nr:hypothetical protein [Hyphomicrobiales bacterium]
MSLQVADNIAKFMGRIPDTQGNRKVMQPDFGFPVARTDVDMRGLAAFIGIEERAIGPQRRTVGIYPLPCLWPSFEARCARTSG